MKKVRELLRDKWGRPEVFLAEFNNGIYGGTAVFDRLDPAIFYVITGLEGAVDWTSFPAPGRKYPYEERTGYEEIRYSPAFRVERERDGKKITGTVQRIGVMGSWSVGNGLAAAAQEWFFSAIRRNRVRLTGDGSKLSARVG